MKFGAPMPRDVINKVASNDASMVKVDLGDNKSFQMKSTEYCTSLAAAMAHNTVVKEINLNKCNITDVDIKELAPMLKTNGTLEILSLEGNKIGSDGAIALANALRSNEKLTDLFLLGQEKQAFGESCLEAWLECLQGNISIQNIKWRLESRKSFALNQCITRNKEIVRRKKEGREFASLLPAGRSAAAVAALEEEAAKPAEATGGYCAASTAPEAAPVDRQKEEEAKEAAARKAAEEAAAKEAEEAAARKAAEEAAAKEAEEAAARKDAEEAAAKAAEEAAARKAAEEAAAAAEAAARKAAEEAAAKEAEEAATRKAAEEDAAAAKQAEGIAEEKEDAAACKGAEAVKEEEPESF